MSYPHHPYGYEPTHCPVIGLMPARRYRRDGPPMTDDRAMDADGGNPVPSAPRRIGFPFVDFSEEQFSVDDIENMIEYVVTTRQGWRASLVMRAFLRWWRQEPFDQTPDADKRRISDAVIMLLALNQGRDGFVNGYLGDLQGKTASSSPNPPVNPTERAFNRSLRIAAIALALSPIVLVFAVMLFVQIDSIISTGSGKIFGFSYDILFVVGSFGAIGALTSMMMRLGKDVAWNEMEPTSVFFNFLFRPCMGFCFAVLVLLALRAGILPIPLDQLHSLNDLDDIGSSSAAGQQLAIVLVFGFLSGFSERMSTSLVRRVEGRLAER